MLDVKLEPANPLTGRYRVLIKGSTKAFTKRKDWRNPYLTVGADGVEIAGTTSGRSPIPVGSVAAALEDLPDYRGPTGWSWQFKRTALEHRKPNNSESRPIKCRSNHS